MNVKLCIYFDKYEYIMDGFKFIILSIIVIDSVVDLKLFIVCLCLLK